MAKLFLAFLYVGLLALPLLAQTEYESYRYHPYAQYRFYHPHPYTRSDFDYTKYYPYRYHWSAHRWYGPYYYKRYDTRNYYESHNLNENYPHNVPPEEQSSSSGH